jgi:CheY-like chemotaxis protein/HPt (histidine-containing phosphotransfer) domain-containing protein
LAEDNSINQIVALGELKELGYTADSVADGLEVLEAIGRVPYDIILMDCQMPNMDGYEATRKIREKEKNGTAQWPSRITIIAMTAHALEGDREKCLQAGMDDYLTKPIEQNSILAALERWAAPQKNTKTQSEEAGHISPTLSDSPARTATSPIANLKPSSSQTVPVDMNRLQRITRGNSDRIKELVNMYLGQTSGLIKQINEAMPRSACKEVEQYAHKICGSSANCGVQDMVQLFRNVEHLSRDGKIEEIPAPLEVAISEYQRVKEYLESQIANMP